MRLTQFTATTTSSGYTGWIGILHQMLESPVELAMENELDT